MPQPILSIIIVYFNSARYLPRCLESLALQTYLDFEIIIVNNGSNDDGMAGLEKKYPNLNLKVEHLPANLGFTVANNIGARLAQGKWLVLLNTDAFPESDWLEKLLQAAQRNPEYASFASRQLQANAPEFLDGAGDAYHISGWAWRISFGYPAKRYGLKEMETFSPCAAAAMYLRDAFLDVGGFDEDFFSYYEDVDLGFRLRLKGYRSLYVPEAVVHHVGSVTFGERSDFVYYYLQRNLIWTFVKNMPSAMLWRYLPAHILANLFHVLYFTLHGRGRLAWQAKYDAVKELSMIFEKRRVIQKGIKSTSSELLRTMERGWLQPYLLGHQLRRIRRSEGLPPK
jgi:GT2 family glycosyltransferase